MNDSPHTGPTDEEIESYLGMADLDNMSDDEAAAYLDTMPGFKEAQHA